RLPAARAPRRRPDAGLRRSARPARLALRRRAHLRPGALLLPGEPDPAAAAPDGARSRRAAHDRRHLLVDDRPRLPERRLPDPAVGRAHRRRAAGLGGLAPAPEDVLPGPLPPPAGDA